MMMPSAPLATNRILSYEERFFGQPQIVNELTFEAPVTVNIAPPQSMAVAFVGLLAAALPLIPLVFRK